MLEANFFWGPILSPPKKISNGCSRKWSMYAEENYLHTVVVHYKVKELLLCPTPCFCLLPDLWETFITIHKLYFLMCKITCNVQFVFIYLYGKHSFNCSLRHCYHDNCVLQGDKPVCSTSIKIGCFL